MVYRHGDVILKQVKELPTNFHIILHEPSCVLAEGEATGHQHCLSSAGNIFFVEDLESHERFIKLDAAARLTHQEHAKLEIAAGIYEVLKEREYDFLESRPTAILD